MLRTRQRLFHLVIIFSVLSGTMPAAWSQTSVAGAAQGFVYDIESIKQPIVGAIVSLRNLETGLFRTATTREDGKYFIANVPPGTYEVTATASGYENIPNSVLSVVKNFRISITRVNEVELPPIALRKIGTAPTITTVGSEEAGEALVNRISATREGSFGRQELLALPLPGIRTFDDLALLLPGVAPPPQAIGTNVGPGVGPGVGTSGQFSVNGMRSRSNNFTVDGSDNNDQDIGVRRQGFTSLVPQSIESVQEFHVITLLPEPQFGRTPGAQADAVSRSGGNAFHGTLYGFFTNQSLMARDPFDLDRGNKKDFPICREPDPMCLGTNPEHVLGPSGNLAPLNPSEGENPFQRLQSGFAIGGPIVKNKLAFFGSFERQDIHAGRESHFAVPTVAERGLTVRDIHTGAPILTGDRGINEGGFHGTPTSLLGDAFFSLFPFPNNPLGPYGHNTFTEVLRADAKGNVFSGKLDWQNLKAFGKDHNLTARYNFTDDDTILPVTGGAILSSLEPLVRTQDLSVIFDTVLSSKFTNQFRTSFGRTQLRFKEVPDPNLPKPTSSEFSDVQFLLNANILRNVSRVGFMPRFVNLTPNDAPFPNCFKQHPQSAIITTQDCIGPLGQLVVSGYSPVGVDVFSFPQSRVNNVFQYADTLISNWSKHKVTVGFDLRRVHLDSTLDRNFRPLAVFTGATTDITDPSKGIPLETALQGRDFVAVGAPTGFTQTLALNPDSMIQLRSWQNYFFFADQIRFRSNLTVTIGSTYQLNTVPSDTKGRIENTFSDPQVKAIGIDKFLGEKRIESKKIYEQDKNNIAPYVSVAWDPFGKGETSIRAGYGIYYDQIPGAVISQSRSVFPSFITLNLAGIDNTGVQKSGFDFLNPASVASNSLNTLKPGSAVDIIASVNAAFKDRLGADFQGQANFGRPDFVLPAADLVTPYAHHWGVTIEQAFKRDFLLSVAYVGTKGVHLLRFATPNLGPDKIPVVTAAPSKIGDPGFQGQVLPPSGRALDDKFGSFTSIQSDASSIYHALQVQLNKRFSKGIQLTTAYTWSHTIDEVSDIFNLAGAASLPDDSRSNLSAERADSNFDVRHRFVYSVIWDLPGFRNNLLLRNWQVASIGAFQTGQPYSVLNFYDSNRDGNLTDRVALGANGAIVNNVGRNLFRAPGIASVDLALNRKLKITERQSLEFRMEAFNLFNRSNLGIPVNQVDFGGLGVKPLTERIFVDTRVPKRLLQFALKYSF